MAVVRKALFPVAGLGSRFFPATKATPKEMLPVVDKPLIQYAVEEAIRAGLTQMIFITSPGKQSIQSHFSQQITLEERLAETGRDDLLALIQNITPPGIEFYYVQQDQPLGLGQAILCAEALVGEEPFAVLLADDLIDDTRHACLNAMIDHFNETQQSLVAVQPVPWVDVERYGVVHLTDPEADFSAIDYMVEKPAMKEARSNLVAVGRYVLTPAIFSCLKQTLPDSRHEIQLTDGITRLLQQETVQAYQFRGKRHDCGSRLGYLQACVETGLNDPDIAEEFQRFLFQLLDVTDFSESDLN